MSIRTCTLSCTRVHDSLWRRREHRLSIQPCCCESLWQTQQQQTQRQQQRRCMMPGPLKALMMPATTKLALATPLDSRKTTSVSEQTPRGGLDS